MCHNFCVAFFNKSQLFLCWMQVVMVFYSIFLSVNKDNSTIYKFIVHLFLLKRVLVKKLPIRHEYAFYSKYYNWHDHAAPPTASSIEMQHDMLQIQVPAHSSSFPKPHLTFHLSQPLSLFKPCHSTQFNSSLT